MGWTLCHYATAPAGRPGCQVTAAMRRGTTALCASCDALRSTLGKGQPGTPIPAPAAASVLDWISQARTRLAGAGAEVTPPSPGPASMATLGRRRRPPGHHQASRPATVRRPETVQPPVKAGPREVDTGTVGGNHASP
jgi:hypothetical protein